MPVKLNSSGGGSVTLDTPSTASNYTLTVPAITGTAVVTGSSATVSQGMLASGVAGNGPAFSAYLATADQSISASTFTKVTLNSEIFDSANCFDSSTNYRFTPNVAGYYQINCSIILAQSSGTGSIGLAQIRKNGVTIAQNEIVATYNSGQSVTISQLIYLNGSTDYVELFGYTNASSSPKFAFGDGTTFMSGFLARAA